MRPIAILYCLSLFAIHCSERQQGGPPLNRQESSPPPSVSVPAFDGSSAFKFLTTQTGFGPRDPGSQGHRNCKDYLQSELQRYADAVNLQPFTELGYDKQPVMMWNIIASFNSKATSRILLMAHWDTRPWADQDPDATKRGLPIIGANDGASGVAVLMEIARHLKVQPPAVGVDIVLVDGEDFARENSHYLRGSKYFARHLPEGYRPLFGIVLDMVGDRQLELAKEKHSLSYAPDIVELVWAAARSLNVDQFVEKTQSAVTDDHLPLIEAGIKAIDIIDFDYPDNTNRYWHTMQDIPENCSIESLEAVGKVLMTVIYNHPS